MSKLPTNQNTRKKPVEHFNKVSTTERQWLVLSMIQRSKWVGTVYIQEQLKLAGFQVSLRTVQRDLVALSGRFLIEHNNSNPQGWRWRDDAPLQSMPNMNLSQAVAFRMVKENLSQLLPPVILKELNPWFDLADQQLKDENSMQSWLEKVHIEPPTLSLIAPEINTQIQTNIYQAVFDQKQLKVSYTPTTKTQANDYLLNPLALVQRGAIIYLLATKIIPASIEKNIETSSSKNETSDESTVISENKSSDDNVRMFSLHRFSQVEMLEKSSAIPENFSLSKVIDAGALGFQETRFDDLPNKGKQTEITLTFKIQAYRTFCESKLSPDQILSLNYVDSYSLDTLDTDEISAGNIDTAVADNTKKNDASTKELENHVAESFNVKATVNLTRQLIWWLRGFGKILLNAEPEILWQVVQDQNT